MVNIPASQQTSFGGVGGDGASGACHKQGVPLVRFVKW